MIERIVTYDVKKDAGHDYTDFYEFIEKYNGKELTESTYVFNTNLSLMDFKLQLAKAFKRGDTVFVISVNSKTNKIFYDKITF